MKHHLSIALLASLGATTLATPFSSIERRADYYQDVPTIKVIGQDKFTIGNDQTPISGSDLTSKLANKKVRLELTLCDAIPTVPASNYGNGDLVAIMRACEAWKKKDSNSNNAALESNKSSQTNYYSGNSIPEINIATKWWGQIDASKNQTYVFIEQIIRQLKGKKVTLKGVSGSPFELCSKDTPDNQIIREACVKYAPEMSGTYKDWVKSSYTESAKETTKNTTNASSGKNGSDNSKVYKITVPSPDYAQIDNDSKFYKMEEMIQKLKGKKVIINGLDNKPDGAILCGKDTPNNSIIKNACAKYAPELVQTSYESRVPQITVASPEYAQVNKEKDSKFYTLEEVIKKYKGQKVIINGLDNVPGGAALCGKDTPNNHIIKDACTKYAPELMPAENSKPAVVKLELTGYGATGTIDNGPSIPMQQIVKELGDRKIILIPDKGYKTPYSLCGSDMPKDLLGLWKMCEKLGLRKGYY
ncbi:hypothetical protein TWF694_000299 [Orbilia ellipsospora]|uniref:Uncharacterized protein n=1 Tax=Orbilia ellipsospora TaxID=2528407 RepID=A0AAV9XP29_9PEZI